MAERRPFPPSPRRVALARASGLSAASAILVGGGAIAALVAAIVGVAGTAADRLGADIAAAANAADGAMNTPASAASTTAASAASNTSANTAASAASHTAASTASASAPGLGDGASMSDVPHRVASVATTVLDVAVPLLVAAAIAALVVHVAQTRTLWFPRRSIPGAPEVPRRARIGLDTLGAAAIVSVTAGWLWLCAPRLATLIETPLAAGAALLALLVTLAIAWIVIGVADALVRHGELADALSMSREDKREDDRLSAADPRWRAQRLTVMRGPAISDAVARAAVVLAGDDIAIAIDWDPVRQPVPLRSTTGRRARATQLVALARRHRVAVHRDHALARSLVSAEGPVPEEHWARLAEIVAAVAGRRA